MGTICSFKALPSAETGGRDVGLRVWSFGIFTNKSKSWVWNVGRWCANILKAGAVLIKATKLKSFVLLTRHYLIIVPISEQALEPNT